MDALVLSKHFSKQSDNLLSIKVVSRHSINSPKQALIAIHIVFTKTVETDTLHKGTSRISGRRPMSFCEIGPGVRGNLYYWFCLYVLNPAETSADLVMCRIRK